MAINRRTKKESEAYRAGFKQGFLCCLSFFELEPQEKAKDFLFAQEKLWEKEKKGADEG